MADPILDFEFSPKIPLSTGGWIAFKKKVDKAFIELACDSKSVYVIRLCRPFAVYYPNEFSPVTYIGRGDLKKRLTAHMKSWLKDISKSLDGACFEVAVSRPKAKNNIDFYKDVEADLISFFEEDFGAIPINNARREKHPRAHTYSETEIKRVFGLGKGKGFKWGIWPMNSNPLGLKSSKAAARG